MSLHRVKRGLDLPIAGAPPAVVEEGSPIRHVALLAQDTAGLRAKLRVKVGDTVRGGDVLFEDRSLPGVLFTSPGTGRVTSVHRGPKRALVSVVIELADPASAVDQFERGHLTGLETREGVKTVLLESGLWTSLRTRPYSRVADPHSEPHSIFVNAMDTQPLAPDISAVLRDREADLIRGLRAVSTQTDGVTYLCKAPTTPIDVGDARVQVEDFSGKHPSGTVGVHIHTLDPVHRGKTVWHLGVQDVLAIGHLLNTGELDQRRVVAMSGPAFARPSLVRTRVGASVDELVRGQLTGTDVRVLSGSVLNGRIATGPASGYLGRYHQQVCALHEGRDRELLGWLRPGFASFSALPVVASRLTALLHRHTDFDFTTNTHGSRRAIIPIGAYERVMPMDIMPTQLLRAISMGDVEWAEELGALELDEEDLALCTYVCPGKLEYGEKLRGVLNELGREA